MRKVRFFSFWLLLVLGTVTAVFNSCGKDETNPDDSGNPSDSLTSDKGVMIDGIKWATRNVDKPGTFTAKPEDPGMFYQWNSKTGWSYSDPLTSSDGTNIWNSSWNGNGATTWEKTNDPCPAGWRMPNSAELQSLISSGNVWTTVNSVNGCKFGSGSNILFLPAVGARYDSDGTLSAVGSYGIYWSSTRTVVNTAYNLYFYSDYAGMNHSEKAKGLSCRCVAE